MSTTVDDHEARWIDLSTTRPGPVRHDLTPEQVDRARRLQAVFVDLDGKSLDEWLDDLRRDADPDAELAVWQSIADALTGYLAAHPLSREAQREAYKLVLLRSMTTEDEVLARLPLHHLAREEALAVMRGYHHAPEPLRVSAEASGTSRSHDA